MNEYSAKQAYNYKNYSWMKDEVFAAWIINIIKNQGRSICDVGCGNGYMLKYYADNFDKVYGIEPNNHMLNEIDGEILKRAAVIRGHAEEIPLESKSVDIVISKSSLHHFYDIDKAMNEIKRTAKNCFVIIEVIAASDDCIPFLKNALLKKEPKRLESSIYTQEKLLGVASKYAEKVFFYEFDQIMDIHAWIEYSDVGNNVKDEIIKDFMGLPAKLKEDMCILEINEKLTMKRKMCLLAGLL